MLHHALPALQHQRFFPLAGAGRQNHQAVTETAAPAPATRLQHEVGRLVELQVAGDELGALPQMGDALGVVLGLGDDHRIATHCRLDQRAEALPARQRTGRKAGVDGNQRHLVTIGGRHQIGPDLGLDDEADGGIPVLEEPLHRPRQVIGQIALRNAAGQILQAQRTGGPSGGRAVRQQDGHLGPGGRTLAQQRQHGGRLTHRHSMHPQRPHLTGVIAVRVWRVAGRAPVAEALVPVLAVLGLPETAVEQIAAQKRGGQAPAPAVETAGNVLGAGGLGHDGKRALRTEWRDRDGWPAARPSRPAGCAPVRLHCQPRSAAPAPAWCWRRAPGQSRQGTPPAVRRR